MSGTSHDQRMTASILAAVSLVSYERPATRQVISLLVDGVCGVVPSEAELKRSLQLLLSWGLVQSKGEVFSTTEAGSALLASAEIGETNQREWIEAVISSIKSKDGL